MISFRVSFIVAEENAGHFARMVADTYGPALARQPGYVGHRLVTPYAGEGGAAPGTRLLELEFEFDSEESRQAWAASDDHDPAWAAAVRLSRARASAGYYVLLSGGTPDSTTTGTETSREEAMTRSGLEVRDERLLEIVRDPVHQVRGGFQFLEGPVWDPGDGPDGGALVFSDIPASRMYVLRADGEVDVYRDPSNMANGNAWDTRGRLVTCEHATSRVVREAADGTVEVLADTYEKRELNSPNDVVVARDGRVLFTDPTYGRTGFFGVPREVELDVRAVYSLDPESGELTRIAEDFDQPNGLCLSDDEAYLYVNDTARMLIRRFAFGPGHLGAGEVWAKVTGEGEGNPDGMKLDGAGNLWCTGPGGVQVFAPDGTCLGTVLVPEKVANFAWGGDDRKTLYLCASTSLYSVPVTVPGPETIVRAR
ncbi:MAG TPA: SMP-30/gluconolactonase/LRE family protein [Trebonia sp.]